MREANKTISITLWQNEPNQEKRDQGYLQQQMNKFASHLVAHLSSKHLRSLSQE